MIGVDRQGSIPRGQTYRSAHLQRERGPRPRRTRKDKNEGRLRELNLKKGPRGANKPKQDILAKHDDLVEGERPLGFRDEVI